MNSANFKNMWETLDLPESVKEILGNCRSWSTPKTREEIFSLAMGHKEEGVFDVSYEIDGTNIREATVTKVRNGLAINYVDPYKSGAAGIKHWIESRYQIEIAKHDSRVTSIKDRIDVEYSDSRVSAISDEEMTAWVEEAFGKNLPELR